MVLALSQALDVPLRDRNILLAAAGFAAIYRETPFDSPALGSVRDAVRLLLAATAPCPTFVVNRRYDVIETNLPARKLFETFVDDLGQFSLPRNLARLLVSPAGLRPNVENWNEVARKVLGRVQRELGGAHFREPQDEILLEEIQPALGELGGPLRPTEPSPLLVAVALRRGVKQLRFFTAITTLGTPLDVTLQELRIETLFPADPSTKAALEAGALET